QGLSSARVVPRATAEVRSLPAAWSGWRTLIAKSGSKVRELSIASFPNARVARRGVTMARYGKKAQQKVGKTMHERKKGTLKSGRSGKKVKSRKQAIAIGLSQARRAGAKVPRRRGKKRKSSRRKK